MRKFYKTSLILTLASVFLLNEGAVFAFEFKNPFKRNKTKIEKQQQKETQAEENFAPSVYMQD